MKKRLMITPIILALAFLSACGGYDWKQADSFRLHYGKEELQVFLQTKNGVKEPSVYFDCEQTLSQMREEIRSKPSSQIYLMGDVLYLVPDGQENACYRIMPLSTDDDRFVADGSTATLTVQSREHYDFAFPFHLLRSDEIDDETWSFSPRENVAYAVNGTYDEWKAFYDLVKIRYTAYDEEKSLLTDSYSLESKTEYKNSVRISFTDDAVSFSFVKA